jgi:hypothetical protein
MGKPSRDVFDPEVFLTKRGKGKTILELRKNQTLFVQGDDNGAGGLPYNVRHQTGDAELPP